MKRKLLILVVAAVCPFLALARAVRSPAVDKMFSMSALVFVGRVKSTEPSGITTTLSYPTWHGATFEWLNVEVEVIEPLKGTQSGDTIRTLVLSTGGSSRLILANPPMMVEPKEQQLYLLCLLPTTLSNVYASLTAPWDDAEAILVLDRSRWPHYNASNVDRYHLVWSLVDDEGRVQPNEVERLRRTYSNELTAVPPTNSIIHLQWEPFKSSSGWTWDVPKGSLSRTNTVYSETPPTNPARSRPATGGASPAIP